MRGLRAIRRGIELIAPNRSSLRRELQRQMLRGAAKGNVRSDLLIESAETRILGGARCISTIIGARGLNIGVEALGDEGIAVFAIGANSTLLLPMITGLRGACSSKIRGLAGITLPSTVIRSHVSESETIASSCSFRSAARSAGTGHSPHLLDTPARFQQVVSLNTEPFAIFEVSEGHAETGRTAFHDGLLEQSTRGRGGEQELTSSEPADSPAMVTLPASPPNLAMFS